MRLEGKVALITGAAAALQGELMGIGGASAWLFVREGAKVVLCDINEELGQKSVAQIRENGGDAEFVRLDVTSSQDWTDAVEKTVSAFGRLDIAVNNAGTGATFTLDETTEEIWENPFPLLLLIGSETAGADAVDGHAGEVDSPHDVLQVMLAVMIDTVGDDHDGLTRIGIRHLLGGDTQQGVQQGRSPSRLQSPDGLDEGSGIGGEVVQERDSRVEFHQESLVLRAQDGMHEPGRCPLLELQFQTDTGTGVDEQTDAQGQGRFVPEIGNGLAPAVFVDAESVRLEIGDEPVLLVGDRNQDVDGFDLDPNRGLLKGAQHPEADPEKGAGRMHPDQSTTIYIWPTIL